jgi:hypothetical protein
MSKQTRVLRRSDQQAHDASAKRSVGSVHKAAAIAAVTVLVAVVLVFEMPKVVEVFPQHAPRAPELPAFAPEFPAPTPSVAIEQQGLIEPPGVAKALKLFAVYPSSDPRVGRAALGAAEASSRTYVTGALLENGAELLEVFDDRALLLRDRRTYTLYLPDHGAGDLLESASQLTVGDFPPAQLEMQAPGARATDVLRVAPAYNGDVIVGFSAYPGAQRDRFEGWGLQSGDVLVRAGGYALNDVAQIEAVMERLAAGERIAAEVLRGAGQRGRVTLDGSVLLAAAVPLLPPPASIH